MILDFVTLLLAVLRLYYLLATDNGPANLLLKFRMRVGIKYDPKYGAMPTNNFAFMLLCPMCATLWYSLVLGVLYTFKRSYTIAVARVLAISMGAVLLMNLQQLLVVKGQNNGKSIDSDPVKP